MRPPPFQWIPTKLPSSPTSSYLTPAFVSIQLQLFSGSPSTALFPFTKHVSSLKAKFFPRLKALRCISAFSWGPFKKFLAILHKSFLRPLFHLCFTRMVSFLRRYQYHQIGTPPPSGQSHHHQMPLVLPHPSSFRGFFTSPTSHPDSFHSFIS